MANNISVTQGADASILLTVISDDGVTPLDLTGSLLTFTVRQTPLSSVLIAKDSSDSSKINILLQSGDTLGQAQIFILSTDTSALTPKDYIYDVWITLPDTTSKPVITTSTFTVGTRVTVL